MLRFSDGVSIDTRGELRCLALHDGLYVVGEGMCIPVADEEDAKQTILKIQQGRRTVNASEPQKTPEIAPDSVNSDR